MVSCKYSEKLNYKEIFNFLSYNRIPLTLAVYKATTGGGKCHKGHAIKVTTVVSNMYKLCTIQHYPIHTILKHIKESRKIPLSS